MRILLTANASYVPPRGGATRSNLVWLELLAASGHSCRVVAASLASDPASRREQMENEQIQVTPLPAEPEPGVEAVRHGAVVVYSAADPSLRSRVLREQIRDFQPDWVLVSSEDLGQVLLREAHNAAPGRVVYLAHTPQLFPFGPASWNSDPDRAELVRNSAAIVAIGQHTAQYIEQHTERHPVVIHPPIYGSGPFRKLGSFESGLITMINPCGVKGISIFLSLAEQLPEYTFGALPGWGTTTEDRGNLQKLPNVVLLPNVKHIEQVLERSRVLLMPSLWYEGFGLSVMEAMLRGVPVIASDSGGLVEAKMQTRFVLSVRAIEYYEPVFDEHSLPKPVIPEQEISPWAESLRSLLSDRRLYTEESEVSRERALQFVTGIRPGQMEEFLLSLKPRSAAPVDERERPATLSSAESHRALASLSDEKRALLLRLLRKKPSSRQSSN